MPNSATLVQALLATFCAILCAFHFSAFGGGGMMISARTASWAKSGGWVNPYVTDGLIAMWDGDWNAGGGVHDQLLRLKDLVGDNDMTIDGSHAYVDSRSIKVNGRYYFGTAESYAEDYVKTIELFCVLAKGTSSNPFLVSDGTWHGIGQYVEWLSTSDASKGNARIYQVSNSYFNAAHTVSVEYPTSSYPNSLYIDGVLRGTTLSWNVGISRSTTSLGSTAAAVFTFYSARFYNRVLSSEELKFNTAIDKARLT